MGKQIRHLHDEADIGSGEKTPADHETENLIDQLGRHDAHKQQGGEQQQRAVKQKDRDPATRHRQNGH